MVDDAESRRVAAELGYEVVTPLTITAPRQTYRVRTVDGDGDRVIKFWRIDGSTPPYPVSAHVDLLPLLAGRLGRVDVPRVVSHGHDPVAGHYVVMTHLDGRGYADRWHYSRPALAGGRAL